MRLTIDNKVIDNELIFLDNVTRHDHDAAMDIICLNIQEAPGGAFAGLAAQAMILVSLWWWEDLSEELDDSAIAKAFGAWRAVATVSAAGGVVAQVLVPRLWFLDERRRGDRERREVRAGSVDSYAGSCVSCRDSGPRSCLLA